MSLDPGWKAVWAQLKQHNPKFFEAAGTGMECVLMEIRRLQALDVPIPKKGCSHTELYALDDDIYECVQPECYFRLSKSEIEKSRVQSANLMNALAAKQAKIDVLMLEFCPGEMPAEQRAEWAKHQRSAGETAVCQCGHPMACHSEFSCQHYGCDCKRPAENAGGPS
ncbi:MAG: hypothetical protein JWO52_4093 [Gammaproteobacteria bacterium]|nr:hypothetical protein [Gammaproteobacteria bacterium]